MHKQPGTVWVLVCGACAAIDGMYHADHAGAQAARGGAVGRCCARKGRCVCEAHACVIYSRQWPLMEGNGAVVGVTPKTPVSFGTPLRVYACTHTVVLPPSAVPPPSLPENRESVMTRAGVTSLL